MENGVSKVEEVKLKVGKDDVLGDLVNGEGNGSDDVGDESVSETVNVEVVDGRKDLNDENGGSLGDSVLLDGSVNAGEDIAEKFKDAVEASSEFETVKAKADMNLAEVIDGESSTFENTTRDQSMVDCDEHEGKVSNVEEVNEEINVSDSTFSDQTIVLKANEAVNDDGCDKEVVNLAQTVGGESTSSNQSSGLEVNEVSNDDNSEEKLVNLAQAIDGESGSDNTTLDQVSELETDVSVVGVKDEVETVGVTNEQVINLVQASVGESISDSTDRGQASELDADMPVVGRKEEVELVRLTDEQVLNLVQATDRESTFDNSVRDHSGELETDVSVVGGKLEAEVVGVTDDQNASTDATRDEPHLLENNVVIENGVNEDGKVSNVDTLDEVHEVNEKPASVTLGHSENGVPKNVDLDETVLQEDGVNADSASHITQLDGEMGVEENVDVNEKDNLGAECKVGDSKNKVEKFESSINKSVNVQSESIVELIQEGEQRSFDSSSTHQDAENLEQVINSPIDIPNSHVEILNSENGVHVSMEERTETPKVEKSEPKDNEVKQDMPLKKEPELRPVTGVPLSAQKPANPKQDTKPNQTPIPNAKPTAAPTPAPSPAPVRPAGLGSGAPLLEPAHRVVPSQVNGNGSPLQNQVIDEPTNGEAEENDDTREKLQMIRVKFLRLARRLGQTPHNVVVAQVLYRLGLAEQLRGRNGGRVAAFSFERASAMAEQLEAAGQEPLEFSCTIMVLGKTGVGKSATINSIFDDTKFGTDAFQVGTKKVQDVVGTVQGIKVRVIDTPGLLPSWTDQRKNEKILHSVKRFIQKSPPDIVLYLDRLDMQSRDSGDMPLLRTITDIFGQSIWFNAIVVLTHAASAPPEGPNGTATSYDMFVTQRSHVVQQAIRQAAGDMRLMNPVSLVENHSACRTNRAGQRVLPNGQVWKPHLLLLSFASKILVEANMLLKLQDSPPGKPFAARNRAPPLPFILSNLLQSRPQLKLPQEQFGDDDDGDDDDMDESSDEESSEYDELPPFKRLTSSQLSKLSKAQKKSYYDELEYREKLFMKKQLKEEKKRRKMMKKMAEAAKNFPTDLVDNGVEEDSNGAASVPVAIQDMNLPASFDADNPTHRYRALDSANQWLIRPVLDPHGWDHDVGYEGINVEHILALKEKIPVSFSGQVTKDKKDANLQMEVSSSMKHGKSKSTTLAFDMQTVGKEMSYTLRSDTRFINYRKNKASAGLSATYFGDSLTGGVKFEDNLVINKRGQLVVAGGAVIGRGDVAYGGSLEATLRDKDYPLGRFLSTISLSVMDWHGDLALGWNAQSQIPIGRFTNLIGRVNLNNKGSGQVSVRLNSSEQLQIALVALVPLVSKLFGYYQDRDSTY